MDDAETNLSKKGQESSYDQLEARNIVLTNKSGPILDTPNYQELLKDFQWLSRHNLNLEDRLQKL